MGCWRGMLRRGPGVALLLVGILGVEQGLAFLSRPLIPSGTSFSSIKLSSRRSHLYSRLSGGQDPPFSFGGGSNSEKGKGAQAANALPENAGVSSQAALALRVQDFMTGQKLMPSIGGMPYMTGNNYVDLFVTVSPDEMISKFKATAPPRVQEAMQRTVLRCIGSMRDFLVEDSHKTTGVLFANLLYKAQVTGYMIFNAEQQIQMQLSPFSSAAVPQPQPQNLLPTGDTLPEAMETPMITGLVRITAVDGSEMEVEAKDYVDALKAEARSLKQELIRLELEKRELVSRDLLTYISQLSSKQSAGLTSGMTQNVVEAMKLLVNRVLASIRPRSVADSESLELDSAALAQLIMWGLVTGYSLRELEKAWGDYGKLANEPSLLQPPVQPSPRRRPNRPPPPPPPPRRSRGPRGRDPGNGPSGGGGGPFGRL